MPPPSMFTSSAMVWASSVVARRKGGESCMGGGSGSLQLQCRSNEHTETTKSLSHVQIDRPFATLRRYPGDVLVRVLDVTRFAVDAVLGVDHEAGIATLLHP